MNVLRLLIPDREARVDLALFRLAHRIHLSSVLAPVVLPLLVVAGFGETLPGRGLAIWLAMMGCAAVSGAAIFFGFRRMADTGVPDSGILRRWRRIFLAHLMVAGTAWGGIALMFDPGRVTQNSALLVVYLGVMSAAVNTTAVHSLRAYFFSVGCSALIVFPMLPEGFGERAFSLQWMLGFYFLVMGNAAWNSHRTMLQSIRLRFANEALLAQKEAEAERAERANREKSLFLAAASHDLRQPVHALLLLVEALRQRTRDSALNDLVEYIRQAGDSIGKLFASLMELSRLESGSEKAEIAEVSLDGVLREIAGRHHREAESRSLRLDLRLYGKARWAGIRTDRVLLGRILDNLVGNAIRYTRRGGALIALRWRHPDSLWLEVWDTGIGIAGEDIGRIFDPYFQVANPERDRSKGLGLGLAIVRRTVELLGYSIEVRSRPGRGSCFRLIVPGAVAAPQPGIAEERMPDASTPALASRRILVVDDDPMVLRAMRALLEGWRADFRCASGYDAELVSSLEKENWTPDCILCDYRLPGTFNGIQVLDLLTDHYPGATGILQTGELAPRVRDEAENAGYLVLTKPVRADLLASTLKTVLRVEEDAPPDKGVSPAPSAPVRAGL